MRDMNSDTNRDTITIHLTPGELLECYHALKLQTRFNTTEQRTNNESAVKKLTEAYVKQEQEQ